MLFRNFKSYCIYLFKLQKRETAILITDFIIFIVSLSAVLQEWSDMINKQNTIITILILSIIKFAYDLYGMIDEFNQYIQLRYGEIISEKINFEEILISKVEENMGFEKVDCKIDCVITSDDVNKYLRDNQLTYNVNYEMEKNIKKFIKDNKNELIPFLKWQYRNSMFYGKGFFNEKKFCLSKNLSKESIVSCHRGTYYDTFLTNQICGKKLSSNKDNRLIANAAEFFPFNKTINGQMILKDITSSMMNNEIGVSTLGITRDNYFVLWTQNRTAQSSNGLIVPTGSGSCDWDDAEDNSFNATIERAMQRELWEESGKYNLSNSYEDIGDTKIIGFFRWIIKGGKPEFVGITKLNVDLTSFYEDKKEVYDRKEIYITSFEELGNIIHEIKTMGNISVPLYMTLYCLEKYYVQQPEELRKFILASS